MNGNARMTVVAAVAVLLSAVPLVPLTLTANWVPAAVVAIALVSGTGYWLRRRRIAWPVITLGQIIVLVLWCGALVARDVAWLGAIPTVEWAQRLVLVVQEGFEAIVTYAAPAPVGRGILLLIVAGVGLVALLSDLLATTFDRPTLTGAPLAAIYVTTVIILGGQVSWIWFAIPAAGYLLLLGAEGRIRVARWGRSATPSARHRGVPETSSLSRSGRQAGAIALGAAVLIPAVLPALSDGLVEGNLVGGSSSGRTIRVDNPVVDLQRNLNAQGDAPVLIYTTESERREYIRAATLDVFDGERWSLSQRDVPVSQQVGPGVTLPEPPGLDAGEYEIDEYRFELTDNYAWLSLPLVYPAGEIEIDGDFRYAVSTLDVHHADEDPRGFSYTERAVIVNHDAETLAAAPPAPRELDPLTELPDGMAETLAPYIEEAVGDRTNRFEQASALQAWFRTGGGFEYDTEVPDSGTSSDELVNFLEVRVGFCQQYSTAMATMARALGIPARVAVGFTPGEQAEDDEWVVRGADAHAWPELYFEGSGWVRFEPTPAGRTGLAPDWTRPDSDDPNAPNAGIAAPIPQFPEEQFGREFDPGGGGAAGGGSGFDLPTQVLPVTGTAAALAFVVSLPWLVARLRRDGRWRNAAGDPAAEAEAAWADLREAAAESGLGWPESATPRAVSRRLANEAGLFPDAARLLDRIALLTERARYAPSVGHEPGLREIVAEIRRELLAVASRVRRVTAFVWPAATRELIVSAGRRIGDGLDSFAAARAALRARLARLLPAPRSQE